MAAIAERMRAVRTQILARLESDFLLDVVEASKGMLVFQALVFGSTPLITRLYTPSDFGGFALMTALTGVLAILATGRYETAVMVPSRSSAAMHIVGVAALGVLFTTVAVAAISTCTASWFAPKIGIAETWVFVALLSTSVGLAGSVLILNNLLVRTRQFRELSASRVVHGLVLVGTTVGLGLLGWGVTGLMLGFISGQFVRIVHMAFYARDAIFLFCRRCTTRRLAATAIRHKRYPIMGAPAAAINMVGAQAPVIAIASIYPRPDVGHFDLMNRTIGGGSAVISQVVGDVFANRLATLRHQGEPLEPLVKSTAINLCLSGAIPTLLLLLFGPQIYQVLFGDAWRDAGILAQIMAVPFLVIFVSSTVSRVFSISGQLKMAAYWQVINCVSIIALLWLFSDQSLIILTAALAVQQVVANAVYIMLALRACKYDR